MDKVRFKEIRVLLGKTQASIGTVFYCRKQTVLHWEAGNTKIPDGVAAKMDELFLEAVIIGTGPQFAELIKRRVKTAADVTKLIRFLENS